MDMTRTKSLAAGEVVKLGVWRVQFRLEGGSHSEFQTKDSFPSPPPFRAMQIVYQWVLVF